MVIPKNFYKPQLSSNKPPFSHLWRLYRGFLKAAVVCCAGVELAHTEHHGETDNQCDYIQNDPADYKPLAPCHSCRGRARGQRPRRPPLEPHEDNDCGSSDDLSPCITWRKPEQPNAREATAGLLRTFCTAWGTGTELSLFKGPYIFLFYHGHIFFKRTNLLNNYGTKRDSY